MNHERFYNTNGVPYTLHSMLVLQVLTNICALHNSLEATRTVHIMMCVVHCCCIGLALENVYKWPGNNMNLTYWNNSNPLDQCFTACTDPRQHQCWLVAESSVQQQCSPCCSRWSAHIGICHGTYQWQCHGGKPLWCIVSSPTTHCYAQLPEHHNLTLQGSYQIEG